MTMNILLFGDSLLARMNKKLVVELESLVGDAIVYNCATGGFNTRDALRRVAYLSLLQPDVVIFSLGANDVAPWKTITSKDEYLQNMQTIFEAFKDSRKLVLICPDVQLNDPVQTDEFNTALHEYSQALQALMNDETFKVVDANEVLAPLSGDYHAEDGLHMNEAAYELLLKQFAAKLEWKTPE